MWSGCGRPARFPAAESPTGLPRGYLDRMKVFAQTLDLKPDPQRIAEYDRRHEAVWPEVLQGLRAIGIEQMRIFRHANRLFMIIETDDSFDPARDYQRYAEDPRTQQWDQLMREFQQRVPDADSAPGAWWTEMREVFDLDAQLGALASDGRADKDGA